MVQHRQRLRTAQEEPRHLGLADGGVVQDGDAGVGGREGVERQHLAQERGVDEAGVHVRAAPIAPQQPAGLEGGVGDGVPGGRRDDDLMDLHDLGPEHT